MKILRSITLLSILILLSTTLISQETCKVLIPELSGTYNGKCKKGLAHGQGKAVGIDTYEGNFRKGIPNGEGVYTWKSGDKYAGYWVEGLRDGEGVYKFKYDGKDSILDGIWKDDKYVGVKPIMPVVYYREFVTRYKFRRDGDGNRILIDLYLNGSPNRDILDFSMISSSGASFENGRSYGLETVVFPVTVKIRYLSWNTAHTMRHTATFEFEISQAGNWQIDIVN